MCDDVNNNEACSFDGGDCCGPNVNTDWCTECLCLEGGVTTPSGSGGCSNWIGDFLRIFKNCQNGTFLPMHENQTFFGPNVFS